MKGVTALFLGIFGTFAFSWAGLTLIPNFQIGHLDPQSDEEGTDIYPVPKSGMAERGRKVYAANGCVYCHSQQVRADYAASDIDRKWGTRRSAPRDYIFERPALIGKTRLGPDLSNIGKRAPSEDASPSPSASPAANAPQPNAATSPAASPAANAAPSPGTSPAKSDAATSPVASPPASAATSAATSPAKPDAATSPAPAPATAANAPAPSPSPSPAANAATTADTTTTPSGVPPQYSAAWHHLHLYSPRSVLAGSTSNMPAFKFLYEKRRVSGERSADALKLTGADALPDDWEVVPSYDAKCLVAYLMSLDQSHELKEAKLGSVPASAPAPASSPAAPKEEKK
jgi:cbb3-type cytochrome oxidase cytochrome c subunit